MARSALLRPWPLTLILAARFLRGTRGRLLGGTARAAIASTALGVMAMVVVMALMSGYRHDLERRLLAGNAAIGVFPGVTVSDADRSTMVERLESIDGVSTVYRVAYGQGSVTAERSGEPLDVTFRGVDPGGIGLGGSRVDLETGPDDLPAILLGEGLAEALCTSVGGVVRLTVLDLGRARPRFSYRSARVGATFRSGFFEFDRSWAVIDRQLLESLTGLAGSWEVALADPTVASEVALAARDRLGPGFEVRNFRDANRDLFEALEVQQVLLFFVLSLIVVVSTFNVASTLVVLVRERLRQLGALAAMGVEPTGLRNAFLVYGAVLGVAGVVLGVAVGSLAAWALDEFELIRLSSELASIYFLSSVPFRLRAVDLGAIALFSSIVICLACLIPARRLMRLDAASALRYQ
jgi:lipoprotein-releasing system permease protein